MDFSDFKFRVAELEDHSALIKQPVDWIKEFQNEKVLVTVESRIVVIDNWLEYRYIQDPKVGNDQKYFSIPLPLFKNSFPFIVCTGYETINIVNVNTMQMQTLISAPCKNIKS